MKNPYSTPKFISNAQQKLGKTTADNNLFSTRLFAWDVFNLTDEGTKTGYDSSDKFVNAVLQAGQGVAGDVLFKISLRPSTTLPSWKLNVKRNTGTENYQQQEDDFSKIFYSKEIYEFIIQEELDFNNKLIFFSFKSIYNLKDINNLLAPIDDTDFYIIDSYKSITKADGTYDYGILRIKKLNPITKRGNLLSQGTGTYINIYTRFEFYRETIQPLNVKRIRRKFYGKPIIYSFFAYGENETVPINYSLTDGSTNWWENLFPFRLTGQAVSVWPLWSQEWKYWYDAIGQGKEPANASYIKLNKVDGLRLSEIARDQKLTADGTLEIRGNQGDKFMLTAPSKTEANTADNNYYWYIYTSGLIVGDIRNFDLNLLIQTSMEVPDFLLPNGYDLFGLRRRNSPSDDGANAIPRKQGTNGYWYGLRDQLLYFFDFMTDESKLVVLNKDFGSYYSETLYKNDTPAQYLIGGIEDYEPYLNKDKRFGSDLRKQNLANLLQRNLDWIGTSWTNLPTGIIIENTLDTNTNTWEYNTDKLNSVIGLFPFDIEQTWNMCNGINFEKQSNNTITVKQDLGIIGNATYNYTYLVANQYRQAFLPYELFYEPDSDNNTYVLEIEFEASIDALTREDLYILGGDIIDVDYFENSYEDSLINGDVRCKINIDINHDGENVIKVELPTQTYPAPNNQGNPRQIYQSIIYGATG